jgi:hypothetical protein
MKSKFFRFFTLLVLMTASSMAVQAQTWHQHIDWAATNGDAGGSVDCPTNYVSMGLAYAIVAGGRSAVINEALFAAYKGDTNRAYQLVLMTQCHNGGAQQELLQAGQGPVIAYLVQNWTPTGIDPQEVQQGIQAALAVLSKD